MVVAIVCVAVTLVGAAGVAVRRARAARRRRRLDLRWPEVSWATEGSALRMLLSGTLSRGDYRRIVEGIAARDAARGALPLPTEERTV